MRQPCNNCPWRVDAPRNYWHPDHFVAIWRQCQDDGIHMMLCHKSHGRTQLDPPHGSETAVAPGSPPLICQGWIRVMGTDAIGVRIALMRGHVTEAEVADETGPDLFASFRAMLVANDIPIPTGNRFLDEDRRRQQDAEAEVRETVRIMRNGVDRRNVR